MLLTRIFESYKKSYFCIVNCITSTYCQTDFNTTTAGAITPLVFTDEEKASGFLNSKAQRKSLFLGFVFTGKERDEETGYGYFGARYYDANLLTGFVSVDRFSDKYLIVYVLLMK